MPSKIAMRCKAFLRFMRILLKCMSFVPTSIMFIALLLPEKLQVRQGENALAPNMSINVFNLMCKVPTPNINVTEEQLLHFWQLPQGVSLSLLMESIGRCRIAVERKSHPDIQPNVCDCVSAWWPLLIGALSIAYIWLSLPVVLKDLMMELKDKCRRVEHDVDVGCECCVTLFWLLVWATVLLTYLFHQSGAGVTYKAYGDLYPRAYYYEPRNWNGALLMTAFMGSLKILHYIACVCWLLCKTTPSPAAKKKMQPAVWKKPQPLCKDVAVETDKEMAVLCWNVEMDSPSSSSESVRSRISDPDDMQGFKAEKPQVKDKDSPITFDPFDAPEESKKSDKD